MQTIELFQLTKWAKVNIQDNQLQHKYNTLINVVNRNNQPNQSNIPFADQLSDLKSTLGNINVNELSLEQQSLLESYDMLDSLSDAAIKKIDDAVYINALDLANLARVLQEMVGKINTGIVNLTKIHDAMLLVHEDENYKAPEYEAIMKVRFDGESSMSNIKDMKKLSSQWYEIIRGLCLVHDQPPESMEIIGTEKGSIIVVFASSAYIIKTLSDTILKILECVEKVYSIKRQAYEIKKLKLADTEIETKLMTEAENVKKNSVELILEDLKNELRISDGEKANALKKSIQQLSIFMEKDGEVDCYIPESVEDNDTATEDDEEGKVVSIEMKTATLINENFKKIRALENRIRLLETSEEVG